MTGSVSFPPFEISLNKNMWKHVFVSVCYDFGL